MGCGKRHRLRRHGPWWREGALRFGSGISSCSSSVLLEEADVLVADPAQVSISTSTQKNVPMYNVTIVVTPKNSAKGQTIKLSRPFSEWFDAGGRFVAAPFQTILATSVPSIGQLDSKRVVVAPVAEAADQKYSAEMLDVLAAATSDTQTASATGSLGAKKGGKRRKA